MPTLRMFLFVWFFVVVVVFLFEAVSKTSVISLISQLSYKCSIGMFNLNYFNTKSNFKFHYDWLKIKSAGSAVTPPEVKVTKSVMER